MSGDLKSGGRIRDGLLREGLTSGDLVSDGLISGSVSGNGLAKCVVIRQILVYNSEVVKRIADV